MLILDTPMTRSFSFQTPRWWITSARRTQPVWNRGVECGDFSWYQNGDFMGFIQQKWWYNEETMGIWWHFVGIWWHFPWFNQQASWYFMEQNWIDWGYNDILLLVWINRKTTSLLHHHQKWCLEKGIIPSVCIWGLGWLDDQAVTPENMVIVAPVRSDRSDRLGGARVKMSLSYWNKIS